MALTLNITCTVSRFGQPPDLAADCYSHSA
jgi:hypothetical protein